jgi:hypothetical protein
VQPHSLSAAGLFKSSREELYRSGWLLKGQQLRGCTCCGVKDTTSHPPHPYRRSDLEQPIYMETTRARRPNNGVRSPQEPGRMEEDQSFRTSKPRLNCVPSRNIAICEGIEFPETRLPDQVSGIAGVMVRKERRILEIWTPITHLHSRSEASLLIDSARSCKHVTIKLEHLAVFTTTSPPLPLHHPTALYPIWRIRIPSSAVVHRHQLAVMKRKTLMRDQHASSRLSKNVSLYCQLPWQLL